MAASHEYDSYSNGVTAALGYNCYVVEDTTNYIPNEGNWLIAVAYCPEPLRADYHFWSRHADGTWLHKPGSQDVMYWDFSNNTITDPLFCDRAGIRSLLDTTKSVQIRVANYETKANSYTFSHNGNHHYLLWLYAVCRIWALEIS